MSACCTGEVYAAEPEVGPGLRIARQMESSAIAADEEARRLAELFARVSAANGRMVELIVAQEVTRT